MQSGKQLHSHKLLPQSPASTEGQERGPGRGSLPPKGHALPCGSAGTHNQNNAEIESSPGFKPITRNGLASVTTFQVADVLDPQEIFSACHPEPAYGKQAKRRISTDPEGAWWPSMNFLNRDTCACASTLPLSSQGGQNSNWVTPKKVRLPNSGTGNPAFAD